MIVQVRQMTMLDTAMPISGTVDLPSTQEWEMVNPAAFEGEC